MALLPTPRRFPPIIAIAGKQRSGKDALASLILQAFPQLEARSFAAAIKQALAQELGIKVQAIEENKARYRPMLIALGQQKRKQHQDYWIHATFAPPLAAGKQGCIITDLRLNRELEAVQYYQALLMRVEASPQHRSQRGALVAQNDPTETELDTFTDWHLTIRNEGPMVAFKAVVEALVLPVVERYVSSP
jgi:phosphomevalonate kinase